MPDAAATLYFDFVDPISYLLERELSGLPDDLTGAVERVAYEVRPPPAPLVVIDDECFAHRWSLARELATASGASLSPPRLVPWSRKAHELHLFARAQGVGSEVRAAVFESYHVRGRDIGRVDVLIEVGSASGLDPTETKAVLDVDRFEGDVTESRRAAAAHRVVDPPTLVLDSARLEGFHNRTTLSTFLRALGGPRGNR